MNADPIPPREPSDPNVRSNYVPRNDDDGLHFVIAVVLGLFAFGAFWLYDHGRNKSVQPTTNISATQP